jgi:hypothetical protein
MQIELSALDAKLLLPFLRELETEDLTITQHCDMPALKKLVAAIEAAVRTPAQERSSELHRHSVSVGPGRRSRVTGTVVVCSRRP